MNEPTTVEPSPLDFKAIEILATEVARDHEFDYKSTTIAKLAMDLGGRIATLEHSSISHRNWNGGFLRVFEPSQFEIFLSPFTSASRDNFTIAHELGHLFLHTGEPAGSDATPKKPIIIHRYLPELGNEEMDEAKRKAIRLEQQANRFAASLLMPARDFWDTAHETRLPPKKAGDKEPYDIDLLAGLFRVSPQAVLARLKSLRMLS